jgi:hypothetical protein
MRSFTIETFRRSELERHIEELIALLDLLDDDADIEDGHDDEPTVGAENDHEGRSQEFWAQPARLDECEAEDEHGGDILDEPHDDDELDQNGDEHDYSGSEDEWRPYEPETLYDGTGTIVAAELLRRAKPRREQYSEIIGTRRHLLQDGSVFTTLVPR